MTAESRQPRREEGEREGGAKEEEKKRKTVEGENLASNLSCVCVRARLPTAMLFFCCHKCHTCDNKGGKIVRKDKKNEEHFGKKSTRISAFFDVALRVFGR